MAGRGVWSWLFAAVGLWLSASPANAIPCLPSLPPLPIVTITVGPNLPINCVNRFPRIDPITTILLTTAGNGSFVNLTNRGPLATTGPVALAIDTLTIGPNSPITILNSGDIAVAAGGAIGINALTSGANSGILIQNSGSLADAGLGAIGINALTSGADSGIVIQNSGNLATAGLGQIGINAETSNNSSGIVIQNSANIATMGIGGFGINAETGGIGSDVAISNSGNIATFEMGGIGLRGVTSGFGSGVRVENSGAVATEAMDAVAILAESSGALADVVVENGGRLTTEGDDAIGIFARATANDSDVTVRNSSLIRTLGDISHGIFVDTNGINHDVEIVNAGRLLTFGLESHGVLVEGDAATDIIIRNSGPIFTRGIESFGIAALMSGAQSPVTILNSGEIEAQDDGAIGISVVTLGADSPIRIENSGSVTAGFAGILADGDDVTIVNSGRITADSLFAIGVLGNATIYNTGTITGFVDLVFLGDFQNRAGGVFEARELSDFGVDFGRFLNREGATVHTAGDATVPETTTFIGLERFENQGLISLVDGEVGDLFEITNCGCSAIEFVASRDSKLAVDAFLGPPGSTADNVIIDGNVSGRTELLVNNVNPGGGSRNRQGIPVVYVEGDVKADAFYLSKPIDAGLFEYDLFFVPTGSGFFELRTAPGGGSHVLPHIITTSQDLLHVSSETWLDRSADLRVLLNRSVSPVPLTSDAASNDVAPALWIRGAGAWLDQSDRAKTTANGRTYSHRLDRELAVSNFQGGYDLGTRDVLSDGDMLVFGPLAGVIHGDLDYRDIERTFTFTAAEAGAYATYLRGGLFVDTQARVHFMNVDPVEVRGLPDDFDATNFGVRTDAGYRFGSFQGGIFVEPLATLGVNFTNVDNFVLDGNRVTFDEETNVRGRLGLRIGNTYQVWEGTTLEPFVIGSLWGTLSGDNDATVVSGDTTYRFTDEPEDLWTEVSLGVNAFNPAKQTTVFAKVDVTLADDTQGLGGKAGLRYNW